MKCKKISKYAVSTLLGLSLASASLAAPAQQPAAPAQQPATTQPANKAQQLIDTVTQGQLTTINTFEAPGNLEGFLLKPAKGLPVIMYADQAGQYVFYGNLLGADGQNLTEENNAKYITPFVGNLIKTNLPTISSFAEGSDSAKYKMYVLADPNCSACHYFYNAAKPFIDKGALQVNWILVSFLKPDSANKAAAIMAASDKAKAMDTNESQFVSETESGGIPSLDPIPKDIQARIDANMAFMSNSSLSSTPTVIWENDGVIEYVAGSPRDFGKFLEDNNPTIMAAATAP